MVTLLLLDLVVFAIFMAIFHYAVPFGFDYAKRLRFFDQDISEFERKRKKTFIGIMKPLLENVVEMEASYPLTEKWIRDARKKWDSILDRAGNPGNINGAEFFALKQVSPVIIFVILICTLGFDEPILLLVIPALSAFFPDMWLRDQTRAHQHQLQRSLPDSMDTFALVVGSGLGFTEAMEVFIEGSAANNPLAEEFSHI